MFLDDTQYYHQETIKKQICLHHTVSNPAGGAKAVLDWWNSNKERVATHFVIDTDGAIFQCMPLNCWAHHLGVKQDNNTLLNQSCIGIELVSWGGLVEDKGVWYNAGHWNKQTKRIEKGIVRVPTHTVQKCEYRGFKGFQRYTDAQIESLRVLLPYLGSTQNIPIGYKESMWELSQEALQGKSGIWSHTSFRKDKSDCYPDTRLIQVLKSL